MSINRAEPPHAGSGREVLQGFLAYQRDTMVGKISGLNREQASHRLVSSQTTLLGIVNHLAYVERYWFRDVLSAEDVSYPWSEDDPDAEWRVGPDDTVESIVGRYRRECAAADCASAGFELDAIARREGRDASLHWILVRMIEETARHCGQADILRELTDGSTGE